ncbi:MAG: PEP-CTERM sorting domain-containing protein [Phycisphaerales bacterium]
MKTLATVVGVLALAGAAQAQIPWNNPNGAGPFFNWANGQNSTGLFGSPSLIGDTFVFFPANFVALSENGVMDTKTDTMSVDLFVQPGYKFDGIRISEFGDYSILGQGSVDATATLALSDTLNPGRNTSDIMGFNPIFPATTGTNQSWQGDVGRDLALIEFGTPFLNIHLEFTNTLVAISIPGSSAVIRKTLVGVPVAIQILPEPGALALLAFGGLVASRRRRA